MIGKFDGAYRWLSNFWECETELCWGRLRSRNVETLYQAAKTQDATEQDFVVSSATPGDAKKRGRHVTLRPDWDEIKDNVMWELLSQKFAIPSLKEKLLATGDELIQEGNTWGDTYWGVDLSTGRGQNRLGQHLMEIRKESYENNLPTVVPGATTRDVLPWS